MARGFNTTKQVKMRIKGTTEYLKEMATPIDFTTDRIKIAVDIATCGRYIFDAFSNNGAEPHIVVKKIL